MEREDSSCEKSDFIVRNPDFLWGDFPHNMPMVEVLNRQKRRWL
jgi:hypothetical protein